MYHIVLGLILNASQNQINHAGQYLAQQKSHQTNQTVQVKNEDSKLDIISQLTKEKELEEKALKPDLESLGLDQIDAAPKNTQIVNDEKQQKPEDKNNLIEESFVSKKEANETAQKKDNKPEKVAIKEEEKPKENEVAIKKNKGEEILKAAEKPIEKIKEFLNKKPEEAKNQKPESEIVENKNATNVADSDPNLKIKEAAKTNNQSPKINSASNKKDNIANRRKKQIALSELQQKRKSEKLEILRRKYLKQNYEENDKEINHYQMIGKIIPKQKIPPKFMNSEVPPPLLNRFRGDENKHHPVIMSNSEKVDFMFKAIADNKIEDFNALYALTKNPNIKNSSGDTLLTFAILMRRTDAVFSILSKGADPDLTNDLGYTPLNIAIELLDYKSTKALIDMGAKVNFADELGRTYLMQATKIGSLQIVDLLIANGADINVVDKNGITALSIAQRHQKDIIAKYLVKYGAKSWVENYNIEDGAMVEDLFHKWK